MKLTNASSAAAGWMVGFQRDGRELLVVMVKATYQLPTQGEPAVRCAEQVPLIEADEFEGEPGTSAPRYETDYAQLKPACDVLLLGSAHAPAGTAARRVEVGLTVGSMTKRLAVIGDRHWSKGPLGLSASDPEPFVSCPISYGRAFGGTDRTKEASENKTDTFLANPAGLGYWRYTDEIDGKPLSNTEEIDRPVTGCDGKYVPMAFSPIGRTWEPRCHFSGTYDENWFENQAPFWPDDFDYRYFQAAPADQVVPYLMGGEMVVLENLCADRTRAFQLPADRMPVTFIPHRGRDAVREAVLDTLLIEPDENRFTLTWRCSLALGKSVFDVQEIIAGEMSSAWQRARRFPNKIYYNNLEELVAARRKRAVK